MKLKASFTIEAAIIVPLTVFVTISFLYMAFYMHDKVVAGSAGAGFVLENAAAYKEVSSDIEQEVGDVFKARLIIADNAAVTLNTDDDTTLECRADFNLPMQFLGDVMGISLQQVSSSVNISNLNPRAALLKYKAVSDGINLLTGDQ